MMRTEEIPLLYGYKVEFVYDPTQLPARGKVDLTSQALKCIWSPHMPQPGEISRKQFWKLHEVYSKHRDAFYLRVAAERGEGVGVVDLTPNGRNVFKTFHPDGSITTNNL